MSCPCSDGGGGAGLGDDSLNDILDALADEKRRHTLHYLQNETSNVASVKDLVDYIVEHEPEVDDPESVQIALHHHDLPKLDDTGLVDYDARSETARYRKKSTLEGLLECLSYLE